MNLGLGGARAFVSAGPPGLNDAISRSLQAEGVRITTKLEVLDPSPPAGHTRLTQGDPFSMASPARLARRRSVDHLDLVVLGATLSSVGHVLDHQESWLHDLTRPDGNPILAWRWAQGSLAKSDRGSLLVHVVSDDPPQARLEDHPTVAILTEAIRVLTVLAAPVRFNMLLCRPRHAVSEVDVTAHRECAELAVLLLSPAGSGVSGLVAEVRVGRYERG